MTTCRNLSILGPLIGILMLLGLPESAPAGDLDSPPAPEATSSYTLEDIYKRLVAGTPGSQSTFTEPAAGPTTGTMHTLNDIMGKAPAVDDGDGAGESDVLTGKTFWGLKSDGWGIKRARHTLPGFPGPARPPLMAHEMTGHFKRASPGPIPGLRLMATAP